ncbi:2-hydroxyacid dehydrogenase [Geoglobus acetivorans]|uniref:D-3-phosphoglycerate dehydrogenase n=1 Tax=Geoglobus acetivorans TaxID=565033 RepID=A0A0A7GHB0_GEOAI|nr:D-3-phosphoglycerate dehydrogenase [Geoglobus acetivorans]
MTQEEYVVVSMSPLPESFVESLFAPFKSQLKGDLKIIGVFGKPRDEVLEILENADVVLGDYSFQMKIDEEMVEHMKKVRLIQQPSTGFDHIDLEACRKHGIPVANAGGANTASVAEWSVMAALMLMKRILYAHETTKNWEWAQWKLMDMGTFDLLGKTWGIIGFGRIGRETARRARAFGARIVYHDKFRNEQAESELEAEFSDLGKLLRMSDVISIHVPLTPETKEMIGQKELRMMKPTAIFINPSRGELVDEEALARALKEKWIMGAAIDVYSKEPPDRDHPLLKLAKEAKVNLLLTPHIAGANADARARIIQHSVQNILRVLAGGQPESVVNM